MRGIQISGLDLSAATHVYVASLLFDDETLRRLAPLLDASPGVAVVATLRRFPAPSLRALGSVPLAPRASRRRPSARMVRGGPRATRGARRLRGPFGPMRGYVRPFAVDRRAGRGRRDPRRYPTARVDGQGARGRRAARRCGPRRPRRARGPEGPAKSRGITGQPSLNKISKDP